MLDLDMRKYLILLFIGLAWGQVDTMWTKIYGDTSGSSPESGQSILQVDDSGFVTLGRNNQNLWLFKTDENGFQEWGNFFEDTLDAISGNSFIPTTDGGYIIVGSKGPDIWLIKTDLNGNEEWNETFRDTLGCDSTICDGYIGNSIQQTGDGDFIITGGIYDYLTYGAYITKPENYGRTERYEKLFLMKVSPQGDQRWVNTIDGLRVGFGVQQTTDGGYIITGQTAPSFVKIFISKTDSLGNEEWRKWFGDGMSAGYSIEHTMDGGYIVAGRLLDNNFPDMWLHKLDSNGDNEWTRTFGTDSTIDIATSVKQTIDGGYIICGCTGFEAPNSPSPFVIFNDDLRISLVKTNSLGVVQWQKTFNDSAISKCLSIDILNDNGYILAGYNNMGSGWGPFVGNSNHPDFYLIRTTSDGSLHLLNHPINPNTFTLHQNYPNPFNPVTTLNYELQEDSFVNVTVYDMLGNVVRNLVNGNQSSGYKSIQWNATNNQGQPASAGIYLYNIQAGYFVDTRKMILLK